MQAEPYGQKPQPLTRLSVALIRPIFGLQAFDQAIVLILYEHLFWIPS